MSSKRMFMIALALAVSSTSLLAADGAKVKKSDSEAATTAQAPAAVAESKEAEKAPRLTIVDPVKDFGVVPKGDKLDWSFVIKNTGNADLQIIAARPGCGCTVADFDKVIKPGDTGKVNAHVDTTNFAGPIAKGVTVETNDPNTPTSQLTIHAIVKPYVEAYPAGFVRFNMLQGDAETQSLVFYSEEEDPFQILKVEVPGDYVKATFKKIENDADKAQGVGRAGQNQYKLDITVGGPDAKIGPLADKVHIVTNSKHQPEYFVSLSGVIRPTIRDAEVERPQDPRSLRRLEGRDRHPARRRQRQSHPEQGRVRSHAAGRQECQAGRHQRPGENLHQRQDQSRCDCDDQGHGQDRLRARGALLEVSHPLRFIERPPSGGLLRLTSRSIHRHRHPTAAASSPVVRPW